MSVRLTETAIQRAAREVAKLQERRDLADAGCPGLRLRLTPNGGKSWVLACRDRFGRMRRFPLGTFPSKGISEAREEARALHTSVKHGGADPVADRRRDRAAGAAAKAGAGTLKALLELYEKQRGDELKRWGEARRSIEVVFKALLGSPLASLKAADFQMMADGYAARHAAGAAIRYVRPILKWGATRGYVDASIANLRLPATIRRRDRVLSRAELAAVLPALRKSERPHAAALTFMLLTLARREEVAQMRWSDVDLTAGTWLIRETKNGQPHTISLSRQALELLFTRRADGQSESGLVFHTRGGGALSNWDRETKTIQEACGVSGWTRHDLRRTGATMLGDMGEMPDIIEAALNHVAIHSPLAATYNRSRYRPQVAAALQSLGDALDGIVKGAGEVVRLQRATA